MRNLHILYSALLVLMWPIVMVADNYVIINQVMYDTPLNEKTNISPYSNGEYIELYNAGTDTVFLQGWQLTGGSASEMYAFEPEVVAFVMSLNAAPNDITSSPSL